MPSPDSEPGWTSPEYVATVVGVLATGALVFYSSVTQSGPTVDEILFVGLGITVPVTIAYEQTTNSVVIRKGQLEGF